MEPAIYNVDDLDPSDRRALEHVIGKPLCRNDKVMINVVKGRATGANNGTKSTTRGAGEIPSWWNIYEGLSDEEIDEIDAAIRRRADLGRSFE